MHTVPVLRIHILFLWIRIQLFFSMRVRIQMQIWIQIPLYKTACDFKLVKKYLNTECWASAPIFNWIFFFLILIKIQLFTISKHFFWFFPLIFFFLDPDPGRKLNADPDPQPYTVLGVDCECRIFKIIPPNICDSSPVYSPGERWGPGSLARYLWE